MEGGKEMAHKKPKATKNPEREGQTKHIEREFEIGKDESWFANIKRLHDEFLHDSLTVTRHNRSHFDVLMSNAQVVTTKMFTDAAENSNLVAKKVIQLFDVAVDRVWNFDEVSSLAARAGVHTEAFVTTLATILAEKLRASTEKSK